MSFFKRSGIEKAGIFIILVVICYLAYAPFLYTPFLNDDTQWLNIIHNKQKIPGYFYKVFYFKTNASFERFYNPLTLLTMDIILRICGEDPFYFRLFCVFVHVCNSFLIYIILFRILKSSSLIALLGAVLFSVNAVHSQTIIWICNIHDSMGVFCLLLLFFVYFSGIFSLRVRNTICAVLVIAGLCYKETFFMSAYLLAFWDWFVMNRKELKSHLIFIGITLIYLALKITGYHGLGGYDVNGTEYLTLNHCIKTVERYVYYLFISCRKTYIFLSFWQAVSVCILIFYSKKITVRLKMGVSLLIFIFPIIFTENDVCGRYFYSLTPVMIFMLCAFKIPEMLRKHLQYGMHITFLCVLIVVHIFILMHEIYSYELAGEVCSRIYAFKDSCYKRVCFFNVPYNVIINRKPSPVRYTPCGWIDYSYMRQKKYPFFILSYDEFSDIKYSVNNWNYDPENKKLKLYIQDKYLNHPFSLYGQNKRKIQIQKIRKHVGRTFVFDKEQLKFVELK